MPKQQGKAVQKTVFGKKIFSFFTVSEIKKI